MANKIGEFVDAVIVCTELLIEQTLVIAVVIALCFINDSNHAQVLWSYAISVASEQSNTAATLTATRLLQLCIKSFHLHNDIKAHFTYLRLLHQLGRYDEFHAQVISGILRVV